MQVHGAAGICDDFQLPFFYAQARTLRFADGPDEVHRNAIAKQELGRHRVARGPGLCDCFRANWTTTLTGRSCRYEISLSTYAYRHLIGR